MEYIVAIALLAIQSIFTLAHWWLYKTLVRFFEISDPKILLSLKIGLGILSVLFVLASVLAFRYYNLFTQIFYTLSASWMGFFNFLFFALCLFWITFGLAKILSITINPKILLSALLIIAFIIGIYGLINARNLKIVRMDIKLPNLPASWQGKTAIWVSDIHSGQIWKDKTALKLVEIINKQNPDMVFIGGDLYDGTATDMQKIANYFSKINAPKGVYFITGNHEEFTKGSKNNEYIDAIKQPGIQVLDNEKIEIEGLQIIGVDYASTRNKQEFKTILENLQIDKSKASILLKHAPFELNIAESAGINFQISGHTHKGQFPPFSWATNLIYHGFNYGFKTYGKMLIYTSSGAGTWGPPMRVFTQPEIVEFKFE
ncbi:MAG: metallophosphoesterase [Candidatus Doudnabacteria bacterium]|nr:metallophosphoesterase [Candidatus Doudnabacteria bacterium]